MTCSSWHLTSVSVTRQEDLFTHTSVASPHTLKQVIFNSFSILLQSLVWNNCPHTVDGDESFRTEWLGGSLVTSLSFMFVDTRPTFRRSWKSKTYRWQIYLICWPWQVTDTESQITVMRRACGNALTYFNAMIFFWLSDVEALSRREIGTSRLCMIGLLYWS